MNKKYIDKLILRMKDNAGRVFAIKVDDQVLYDTLSNYEENARDCRYASWWIKNPQASIVELELVEKK